MYKMMKGQPFVLTREDILNDLQGSTKAALKAISHMKKEQMCAKCHKYGGKDGKLKKCSGCNAIFYCSPECQKLDWKRHKHECKKM